MSLQIPEIYLAALEENSNENHRECQELEALTVKQKATIADLKTQLRQLAEKQRLNVISNPEIAIAILESYLAIEQRNVDTASRLSADVKQSNGLGDRYTYSQQQIDLKESRRLLKAWRSLLERFKADTGVDCDRGV